MAILSLRKDKTEQFYEDFGKFTTAVRESVFFLSDSISYHCAGKKELAKKGFASVLKAESEADVLRRKLEKVLYSGVIIPFGRSYKYELIEAIDDIADRAEILARFFSIGGFKIPKKLNRDIGSLMEGVKSCVKTLEHSVNSLNTNMDSAVKHSIEVRKSREAIRDLEFKILGKLFSSKDHSNIDMIIVRDIITLIGTIADKSEEASDRVINLAVKYQL